jgi:hypothetical protein
MKLHSSLALLAALFRLALANSIDVYPNTVNAGNSVVQFVSGLGGLDGPKVKPNNGTSYDWWYFDAVSTVSNCSIVIVFYVATNAGFPFLLPGSAISANVFATFEDGTSVFLPVNNQPSNDGSAIIVTDGNGSAGYWESIGAQWVGSPTMSNYVITIDSPTIGVKGTLTLSSVCSSPLPN